MARNAFGVILILLSVLVSVFWSYPMWNDISEEIAKKRDEIQAQYNSLSSDDTAKLNEFFPKNQEPGLLILNIDKLASSNGMLLKKIDASEGVKNTQQRQ